MTKILRIAAALLVIALAIYLATALLFVFLVIVGLGMLYVLVTRFFGKSKSAQMSREGVTIEHETIDSENERK